MKLAATFTLLIMLFCIMALPLHWKTGSLSTADLVIAELSLIAGSVGLARWIHRAFRNSRRG
jgi:hypothetical protein